VKSVMCHLLSGKPLSCTAIVADSKRAKHEVPFDVNEVIDEIMLDPSLTES
jgi:hypothetical protein